MGRKRKRFYTRDEFGKLEDVGKAIIDSSCVVIQRSEGKTECINRRITDDIVALTKFMVVEGDDAFVANIPSSLAEELGFSEKQVFRYAIESAQKKLPFELAEVDDGNYILHTGKSFGAGAILYDGVLPYVANELNDDCYIFPVSEDYLKVIRKSGMSLPEARFNATFERDNILSDDVFVYYKDHDLVRLIGNNDQNMIYLQKGVMQL